MTQQIVSLCGRRVFLRPIHSTNSYAPSTPTASRHKCGIILRYTSPHHFTIAPLHSHRFFLRSNATVTTPSMRSQEAALLQLLQTLGATQGLSLAPSLTMALMMAQSFAICMYSESCHVFLHDRLILCAFSVSIQPRIAWWYRAGLSRFISSMGRPKSTTQCEGSWLIHWAKRFPHLFQHITILDQAFNYFISFSTGINIIPLDKCTVGAGWPGAKTRRSSFNTTILDQAFNYFISFNTGITTAG